MIWGSYFFSFVKSLLFFNFKNIDCEMSGPGVQFVDSKLSCVCLSLCLRVCLCVCVLVFVFVACMWVQPLALLVRSSVSPNCVIFIHEWRNKAACPPLSSCPSTIIHHSYDKYGRTALCLQQWHHNHNICWKMKLYGHLDKLFCCIKHFF